MVYNEVSCRLFPSGFVFEADKLTGTKMRERAFAVREYQNT